MPQRSTSRTLRHLADAAARGVSARIRFRDTEARDAERTVDVLGFSFDAGRWLVATWTRELGSLRLLDLTRIRSVRPTSRPAARGPEGFDPVWFALGPLLGGGPTTPVRVPRADAALAPAVLPAGRWRAEGGSGRTWLVHSCDRPRVRALAASLGWGDALESPPAALSKGEGVDVASPEARILKLVSYILAQPAAVTAEQIYERFAGDYGDGKTQKARQAREKKFSRDKAAIKRLGFVLLKEGETYLIDPRSSALPKVELDAEEALAVWTAALAALRHSDHPLREDLESALRKMMSGWKGLPPRAAEASALGGDGAEPSGAEHLDDLVDAWLRRKRITIEYWHPGRDETETRQVDVYGFARRRGEWIFVGHCHKRDAVRVFYLSRVRKLTTPQAKAAAAKGTGAGRRGRGDDRAEYVVPEDFDIRRWSRQQPWDYVVHEPKPAAVRFSGSLAKISHQLLPGLRAAVDDQGRRTYRLEVRNLRGLVRQALAWGPEAELLEPPEGRALALEILRETRALVAGGRP